MYGTSTSTDHSVNEYTATLQMQMDEAFGLARQHSLSKRLKQKELYDLQVHGKPFKKDDHVWVIHESDKHGLAKSCITHGLHDPYKVFKKWPLQGWRSAKQKGWLALCYKVVKNHLFTLFYALWSIFTCILLSWALC